MTRARDELWDALTAALGVEQGEVTETERARLNKCLKELRAVKATSQQIRERCAAWEQLYKLPTNPQSLAANWGMLGGQVRQGVGRRHQPHDAAHLVDEPPMPRERRLEVARRMAELARRIGRDVPSDDNGRLSP